MTAAEALSWTLVHFLWQGALIGLGTMVAFWMARRPETRYVAGCVGLAAMGAAAIGTFAYLWGGGAGQGFVVVVVGSETTWLETILPWVNRVWAAGTGVLLLRALGGWLVARRRARTGLSELSAEWRERASALVARLGISGRVRIFESAAVNVPMVFGWVKPLVLLPACALSGLTVRQVEALLAHELAHVRRHDYLMNLMQTGLESLLFYHPAVWWVSSRVRRERELCCDEIAVEVCGDRVLYSHALLRMEETRMATALAASGGNLKERIGRLLGMSETRMGWTPVWMLGGVLAVCMGVAWAKTDQAPPPPPPPPAAPEAPAVLEDTKPPVPPVPPAPPVPPEKARRDAVDRQQAKEELRQAEKEMMRADAEMQQAVFALKQVEVERVVKQIREAQGLSAEDRGRMEHEIAKARAELEALRPRLERSKAAAEEYARSLATHLMGVQSDEIERRFRYAEALYGRDGVNGVITDRGRLYVTMGPPDEIESHPGVKEIWLYRATGKLVEFDGAGKRKK